MLENWFFILAVTGVLVHSQATSSQTFWPAAVPLAVRSPYLNAWMATLNGTAPLNIWPTFWTSDHVGALVFSCTLCLGVIDPKFPDLGLGGLCSSWRLDISMAGGRWPGERDQLDEYVNNTDAKHLHSSGWPNSTQRYISEPNRSEPRCFLHSIYKSLTPPLNSLLTGLSSHSHFLISTSMRCLWTANRTRSKFTLISVQVIHWWSNFSFLFSDGMLIHRMGFGRQ